ncbi:MAG: hypothetical protein M3Y37_04355 [Chloroflexota bacterium]|nr:hypothetical protein [Chloroflexota bacterium]
MAEQHDTTRAKGISGPDAGFGRLWRKIYRVELTGVALEPAAIVAEWKREFSRLWPGDNRFFAPITGLREGEVAEIQLAMPGGISLSTGVRLLYSTDLAFSLMAPPGHIFSGWTTFSSYRDGETTVGQVEVLMRASDPAFEIGLELFGHRHEDQFWRGVLANLARHLGVEAEPTQCSVCVDRRFLVRNATNLRFNSVLRHGLHLSSVPIQRLFPRRGSDIEQKGAAS